MKVRARHLIGLVGISVVLWLVKVPAASALDNASPTSTSPGSTAYSYTAIPGSSLSRFIRKSIQLHSQLTPAAALYCEDTLTRQYGAIRLNPGDAVTIAYSQLDACAIASRSLTSEQLAAWQAYVPTVSFDTSDITAQSGEVTAQAAPQAPAPAEPAPAPEPETTPVQPEPSSTQPDATTAPAATTAEPKSQDTYWWFIGAAMLIAVFIIFGGPMPHLPNGRSKR